MNRWLFLWRRLVRQLWVRATAYAVFAVAAALSAAAGARWVPREMAERFGGESIEAILNILASSLLAVATFSVGAMVSAYTAVSSAATPRVSELITSDAQTQKSLATFVGAFLYSVVAVTAVNAHYYGAGGRAILFLFSLGVVALVAYRLLAWINRLGSLARVGHMIELVERLADTALCQRAKEPHLGGVAGALEGGHLIDSPRTGYIQNIDTSALDALAEDGDGQIQLLAVPGDFVRRGDPLCRVTAAIRDDGQQDIARTFVIGPERSFDQDPRFGLVVLGEIAGKALSPGINDPGTAIQVIGAGVRLLDDWSHVSAEKNTRCARILAPALDPEGLLDDLFGPIGRYGAGDIAVAKPLQHALLSLARDPGPLGAAAKRLSDREYRRACETLTLTDDLEALARSAGR